VAAIRTVRFDDFSGGHWGLRDQSKVASNMWFGSNMQVYQSGLLGPRDGLRLLALNGVAYTPGTGCPGVLFDRNTVMVHHSTTGSNGGTAPLWVNGGSSLVTTNITNWNTVMVKVLDGELGVISSSLGTFIHGAEGTGSPGNGVLGSVSSGVVTAVTAPTTGAFSGVVVRWRDRLVAAPRTAGAGNGKIFFSNAADFATWPAANFLVINNGEIVQWLFPAGDVLYAGTQSAVFAITGVLGASASVRHVVNIGTGYGFSYNLGTEPSNCQTCVVSDGRLALVRVADVGTSGSPRSLYAFFNGSSFDLEYNQADVFQGLPQGGPNRAVVAPAGQSALYSTTEWKGTETGGSFGGNSFTSKPALRRYVSGRCEPLLFHMNTPVDAGAQIRFGPGGVTSQNDRGYYVPSGLFICSVTSTAGASSSITYWDCDAEGQRFGMDRVQPAGPSFTGAFPVLASVRFPTSYTQNDKLVRLRSVIINGRIDPTNASDTACAITLRAGATGFQGANDLAQGSRFSTSITQTFTAPTAPPADSFAYKFNFGDSTYGEGVFLDITSIAHISIRSVTYVIEEGMGLA
jgi:hypothetical protein